MLKKERNRMIFSIECSLEATKDRKRVKDKNRNKESEQQKENSSKYSRY